MAADVIELNGQEVETLASSSALIKIDDGVFVGNALVVITDIEASNGAINLSSNIRDRKTIC